MTHEIHPDATHESSPTADEDSGVLVAAVASVAAMGAAMAARSVMQAAYRGITGHRPPRPEDPTVPFGKALGWTVATAVTAAVIEMVIQRASRRLFHR